MHSKLKPHDFQTGDLVELIEAGGMHARTGSRAVVVERTYFSDYLQQLVQKMGDDSKYFVSVKWVDEPSCSQSNGFYAQNRFRLVSRTSNPN